jgi:hypothetical protein
LRDVIVSLPQLHDHGTGLHDQLAHLGQQACQHLTLFLFALGKQVVFFD